ncbi:hypothetical protein ABT160_23545 [Streptomyces sp. NPDC001941]|uniref:hypothetical protein n=1 Tax=Streptomyces sp. NPDC001941 TaxID=3154659 RepID=UPI003318C5D4
MQDYAVGVDSADSFSVTIQGTDAYVSAGRGWVRDTRGGVYWIESDAPARVPLTDNQGWLVAQVFEKKDGNTVNDLVFRRVDKLATAPRALALGYYSRSEGQPFKWADHRFVRPGDAANRLLNQYLLTRTGPAAARVPDERDAEVFRAGTQYTDMRTGVRYVRQDDGNWFRDGNRIHVKDSPAAPAGVPAGDLLVRTDVMKLYEMQGAAWVEVGTIRGDQGPPGTLELNSGGMVKGSFAVEAPLGGADLFKVQTATDWVVGVDGKGALNSHFGIVAQCGDGVARPLVVQKSDGTSALEVRSTGAVELPTGNLYATRNVRLGDANDEFGGGSNVLALANSPKVPTGAVKGGVGLFARSGELFVRTASGEKKVGDSDMLLVGDGPPSPVTFYAPEVEDAESLPVVEGEDQEEDLGPFAGGAEGPSAGEVPHVG